MYNFMRYSTDIKTFYSIIRLYSLGRKNHYEVLRLQKNCTDKEIKEAYIRLSKEYHPDKNKDDNAHKHFVQIVEAYNVLGKRSKRVEYDYTLRGDYPSSDYYYRPQYNYRPNPQQSYYTYGKRPQADRQSSSSDTYYGGLGVNRIPKYVLVLICFGVAIIGTVLQVFVIREMYVNNRKKAIERSMKLADELDKVRASAKATTNEILPLRESESVIAVLNSPNKMLFKRPVRALLGDFPVPKEVAQTKLLLEKIVGSANPTIATASLGQSLASDKKTEDIRNVSKDEVSNAWYPTDEDAKELTIRNVKHVLKKLRVCCFSE